MCFPADEPIGPGDRFIATELASVPKAKKFAVVTKIDSVTAQETGEQLLAVARLGAELGIDWAQIVPVSASRTVTAGISFVS
jgi:GTP-binding protein Era